MEVTLVHKKYQTALHSFHHWRYHADAASKIVLTILMACMTGLLAQFSFYIPWTPVPVTGQTFAVLVSGAVLGRWGAVSQFIYLMAGMSGVAWFAGQKGGAAVLLGPTGGYLLGFMGAAWFVGVMVDRSSRMRKFLPLHLIMITANFFIIYGCGLIYLYIWLGMVKGSFPDVMTLLNMGAMPFIPGDIIKMTATALFTYAIVPREDYAGK